ncbi:Type 1 glutamine amidotransferase-like domain-containing protein [Amedibacillus sp. YH-ame10]
MKLMVAIGGGSFQKGETKKLDQYIISCTNKVNPKVLFLPTASKDDQGYAKRFKQYYRSLGCEVESLRLFHTKLGRDEIKEKICGCDIIYIGAGNMRMLMQAFQDMGIVEMLQEAYQKGVVCVGMSAGASCFFTYGYSDLKDDGTVFDYVKGCDFIKGCFCPHAQDDRRKGFYDGKKDVGLKIACKDLDAYIYQEEIAFFYLEKNTL